MGERFTSNQILGRSQTIGCVAVEITQKCNLDCTLCYLSEHSQSVKDIPISEVFRRLDLVVTHYGKGTHVQITGGDPTLRKHAELIDIVRYASEVGLYPALFTNGIAASRELLGRLAAVGLRDVAFHVDTTQRRTDYESEQALNVIREEYIKRCRGLGLMVIFNTTVHRDNFAQIPQLVSFFVKNADAVGFVSFQLQAETGRGDWRARDVIINQQSVRAQIEEGTCKSLPWDVVQIGHGDCHNYMPTVVVNGKVFPVIEDVQFFASFLQSLEGVNADRHSSSAVLLVSYLWAILKKPNFWPGLIRYAWDHVRSMWKDVLRGGGRVDKLSFFVQNFMDADHLVEERLNACSFMVMTAEGPVSMCQHNAKRDDYILQPLKIVNSDGREESYEPLPVVSERDTMTCQQCGDHTGV